MTFEEALAYISGLAPRGWRLGLDRMEEFVRRLGLEPWTSGGEISYIHVAGTNGKGSTTAFVQYLLHHSGLRTGAFFSPYVNDPRERVQIGLEYISKAELARLTEKIIPAAEGMSVTEFGGITEFEFKTALGFMAWKESGCDWVALETGLGGRLDATNVVIPKASIISSIGLDHMAILGDTKEKIAFEKAGIIKPGRPIVLGRVDEEASTVIRKVAQDRGSQLYEFGRDFHLEGSRLETPWGTFEDVRPRRLYGDIQTHNLAIAITSLLAAGVKVSADAAARAADEAYLPGRFEIYAADGVPIVLDGAHNSQSAEIFQASFESKFGKGAKAVVITNMVTGHSIEDFYRPLLGMIEAAIVPPIEVPRARDPLEVQEALVGLGTKAELAESANEALNEAVSKARKSGLPVVIVGSFYLVGAMDGPIRQLQRR